jgi:hypothetical protein
MLQAGDALLTAFRFEMKDLQESDSLLVHANVELAACVCVGRLGVLQPIQVIGFSLFETGRLFTRDLQKRSRALALDLMGCRALAPRQDSGRFA